LRGRRKKKEGRERFNGKREGKRVFAGRNHSTKCICHRLEEKGEKEFALVEGEGAGNAVDERRVKRLFKERGIIIASRSEKNDQKKVLGREKNCTGSARPPGKEGGGGETGMGRTVHRGGKECAGRPYKFPGEGAIIAPSIGGTGGKTGSHI